MQVGFIGMGVMGLPMAGHIITAGHTVTVSSRSQGPVDQAVALGAIDGRTPAGVAEASDVIVVCVPDTPDVQAVVEALIASLRPGAILLDCSTIDPAAEIELHHLVSNAGGRYLDGPVSGGSIGAQRGTLSVMVGGDAATLDEARPVIEAFSSLIVHVGGPGAGQVVKLANNLIYAAQMAAVAEAFTMVNGSSVSLAAALEVLSASTGNCTALQTRIPFEGVQPESPVSNGWKPGFATALMTKDLRLALAHGERVGVRMRATEMSHALHAAAVEAGYGADDMASVGRVVRAEAGQL